MEITCEVFQLPQVLFHYHEGKASHSLVLENYSLMPFSIRGEEERHSESSSMAVPITLYMPMNATITAAQTHFIAAYYNLALMSFKITTVMKIQSCWILYSQILGLIFDISGVFSSINVSLQYECLAAKPHLALKSLVCSCSYAMYVSLCLGGRGNSEKFTCTYNKSGVRRN